MHREHDRGGREAHNEPRWFGGLDIIHVIVSPTSADVFLADKFGDLKFCLTFLFGTLLRIIVMAVERC